MCNIDSLRYEKPLNRRIVGLHSPAHALHVPPFKAKFEVLARTWGLFRGALDSTPGKTTDNNDATTTDNKPSPGYHAECLGARGDEGHGKIRGDEGGDDGGNDGGASDGGDGGSMRTPKRVCENVADGLDIVQTKDSRAYDSKTLEARDEGGHGGVQDDRGIYKAKRECEGVVDGTDMLQGKNPHAFDSPPRSHQPSDSGREYDQGCSRSPELVMLWDVGGPPDEDQVQEAVPASLSQELQGRRQLW